jgi:hypothetical protein
MIKKLLILLIVFLVPVTGYGFSMGTTSGTDLGDAFMTLSQSDDYNLDQIYILVNPNGGEYGGGDVRTTLGNSFSMDSFALWASVPDRTLVGEWKFYNGYWNGALTKYTLLGTFTLNSAGGAGGGGEVPQNIIELLTAVIVSAVTVGSGIGFTSVFFSSVKKI